MSSIALVSLQLLIMIIAMLATAIGESSSNSDIDCLRSIKESLEDPLDMLSKWQFDNSPGKLGNFICSFHGVECWHVDSDISNVLNIELTGMGLKGEFPRGLANCSSLTGLNLSNNHLYGSIPWDVSTLFSFGTLLDLSSNEFSGEIPPDIANCTYLNVLMLDNNLFTGRIPAPLSLLQRLKHFSVANNHLSGPVPGFPNAAFPPEIYANNTGLCGYPLDPCKSDNLFLGGFFAGWGVFFTLSLVVGLFTPFWEFVIKFIKRRVIATPGLHSSNRMDDSTTHMLEKFATRMSFLELSRATNEFNENNVITAGETGTTYKATVPMNGSRLAIKRLIISTAPHIEQAFRLEILVLGRLRHRNLVPLLGFCYESGHRLLVHKHMPNGSLHNRLFSSGGKAAVMEWPVRVRIAVGVANGIAWLHRNRVVHRGISSKCVLLDENLDPKISDFRNAIAPNETYSGWGLPLSGQLSVVGSYEQDVHGFGTVLLELVTGIRYEEIIRSFDIDGDMSEQIFGLLNVSQASMEQEFGDEISCLLGAAAKCVECDPGNWPSMEEVYQMLRIGTRRSSRHDTC